MKAVAYIRVSSKDQNFERQRENLTGIARQKKWELTKIFSEKISGNVRSDDRKQFKALIEFIKENKIQIVMVSEVSRLGRKVVDILNVIEYLHSIKVGVYVEQFNMVSFENGKENPTVKLLLQMMSIGAELENNLRKERQRQGIAIAKAKGTYIGRLKGSIETRATFLQKHEDVVKQLKKDLSLRDLAKLTNKSVNTVRKVKELI